MNRILLLILIGGITFLIILFVSRPELLTDFWLWAIGLAGPIIKVFDAIIQKLKSLVPDRESGQTEMEAAHLAQQTKNTDESKG